MRPDDISQRLAVDARNLQDLKSLARSDPRAALQGAAQQFEAFFMQMMLKSMRETLAQDGLFDSEQTRFFTGMHDQQMAQTLGSSGSLGFAKLLERQLGTGVPETSAGSAAVLGQIEALAREKKSLPVSFPAPLAPVDKVLQKNMVGATSGRGLSDSPRDFVATIWPHAQGAAAATGIPAHFLVAQAALESGWGKAEILREDGSGSFNLFGIKAGSRWQGESVTVPTTEYVDGKAQSSMERFRAYGSYQEAFTDYAALLKNNPRFQKVVGATDGTDFANSLQQSGYATDPMYGAKLLRILQGKTLRDALLG